jgi:hypothetical protein
MILARLAGIAFVDELLLPISRNNAVAGLWTPAILRCTRQERGIFAALLGPGQPHGYG